MTTSTTLAEDRVREYAAQIVEFAPDMTKQDADELSADLNAILAALQALTLRVTRPLPRAPGGGEGRPRRPLHPLHEGRPAMTKAYIVWNQAKNEGIILTGDDGKDDAEKCVSGDYGYSCSSLAEAFREMYGDDGDLTVQVVTLPIRSVNPSDTGKASG